MFKIEKGIPVPEVVTARQVYPWGKMAIGESFFVKGANNIQPHYAELKYGFKFVTRKEKHGVRVWRTA